MARLAGAKATGETLLLRVDGASFELLEAWLATLRDLGFEVLVHARCAGAPEHGGVLGVHLPAHERAAAWRARVPGLLGQSVHSIEEALVSAAAGADYVMLSPIFTPRSKPEDTRPTLGLDGLAAACAAIPIPVIALGGVGEENAEACFAAGACAVARMAQSATSTITTAKKIVATSLPKKP